MASNELSTDLDDLFAGDDEPSMVMPGGVRIEALPKISLHDHLDGGLRPETIIDIAKREGVALPTEDADELAQWFVDQCTGGTLPEYLETFELTLAVMQHPEDLRRVAHEWVLDLADEGVIYGEARWAPEQHLRGGLTLEAVVDSVQAGLEDGMAQVIAEDGEIHVNQVLCAMRQGDRSLEIAELALKHRDDGVVGFDLAGPEEGFPAGNHLAAIDLLARNQFPTTIHAGEADGIESVKGALSDGRALRLGHGTRLAEDITIESEDGDSTEVSLGRVAQWVRDRGIALECCPSSNVQTGAFSQWGDTVADHPFDVFYQLGMNVTVGPDNRLMSATTVSRELALLAEAFSYDLGDLQQFQVNAAMAAFLPLEDRKALVDEIEEGFVEAVRQARAA